MYGQLIGICPIPGPEMPILLTPPAAALQWGNSQAHKSLVTGN